MLKDGERFAFWSEFQQTRAQEGLLDAKRGSGCSRERRSLRMNGRRERDGGTAQSPRTPNWIRKSRHHRRSPILWTMNPVCLPRVHGRMHGDGERAGADSRGGVGLERGLERPLHVLRHRQTQHRLVELRSPGLALGMTEYTLQYDFIALETEVVLRSRCSFTMSIQTQTQPNHISSELRITPFQCDLRC